MVTIVRIIVLRVLSMSLCGFCSIIFWVIRKIILYIILIIISCNQCLRCFLCSWFNINLNMMKWQACRFSVPIAKTIVPCMLSEAVKIDIIPVLSKPFGFTVLVYNGWYKQSSNMIFLLKKISLLVYRRDIL